MAQHDHTSAGPSFRAHSRRTRVYLRSACGPEHHIASPNSPRWQLGEAPLAPPSRRRIVTTDGELLASTSTARGRVDIAFEPSLKTEPPQRILERTTPTPKGHWVLKTGLWVDPRVGRRLDGNARSRLLRCAGPLAGALACYRDGLAGYFAAVVLRGQPRFAPAVDPVAYVQQVEAQAVDEPLLQQHLAYGARPVAVVDQLSPPAVVMRWKR